MDDIFQGGIALSLRHVGAGRNQMVGLGGVIPQVHIYRGSRRFRVTNHHREPGVRGIRRNGNLLPVQGFVGPVIVVAGIGGVVGDVHVIQSILYGRHAGVAVLIGAHDDADAPVKGHPRVHQGLGGKQGSQGGAAVVLHARTVQPAVTHIGGMVGGRALVPIIIYPAR